MMIVTVLMGCSTKFIYQHVDWFVMDYLDDYVTLTEQQEKFVSKKIALVSRWHQSTELINYVEHFDQLAEMNVNRMTLEQIHQHRARLYAHYVSLIDQVFPDIYPLARELNDEQVAEFLSNIDKRHDNYVEKFRDLSESDIRKKYYRRITTQLEHWLGSLTEEQVQLVYEWSYRLQVTSIDWMYAQAQLRVELESLLLARSNQSEFNSRLKSLLYTPETYYSPVLKAKLKFNEQTSDHFLLRIAHSVTDEQQEHLREALYEWRSIVFDLHQSAAI